MHKYERIIYWSEADQKFIVEVPELAGCMADGMTPVEALENVEVIISEWIESAKEIGREIPLPNGTTMSYDCGFQKENNWFRYRAAAIIVEDGCVLFAGNEVDDYYYSVGGGVHMNETAEEAVVREVLEETGVTYEVERLAVIHENFFENPGGTLGNIKGHELAFYFLMKPRGTKELHSNSVTCGNIKEHMHWIPIEDIPKVRAFPTFLKDYLKEEHKEIVHIVTHEGA